MRWLCGGLGTLRPLLVLSASSSCGVRSAPPHLRRPTLLALVPSSVSPSPPLPLPPAAASRRSLPPPRSLATLVTVVRKRLVVLCWEGSSRQVVLILAAACTSTHPIDSHSIRPAPCYPPLHTAGLGYPRTASFNAMCFTLLLPQAAVDAQRPTMVVSFYHCRHLQHRRLRGASSGLTPLTVIISV